MYIYICIFIIIIFFSAVLLQQCQCTGAIYWIHWWRKVNQLGVGYRVGFLFFFHLLLVLLLILSCFSFYFYFFLNVCLFKKKQKTLMVTHVTYLNLHVWDTCVNPLNFRIPWMCFLEKSSRDIWIKIPLIDLNLKRTLWCLLMPEGLTDMMEAPHS